MWADTANCFLFYLILAFDFISLLCQSEKFHGIPKQVSMFSSIWMIREMAQTFSAKIVCQVRNNEVNRMYRF